jgi:hypothetical protein
MGWKIGLIAVFFAGNAMAQEVSEGERAGLVQATASFYPTFMLNRGVTNNYIGGYLNIRFDDKYSFRGDIYRYLSNQTDESYINDHTFVQCGFLRHFPIKRFDPFIGATIGLSGVETNDNTQMRYQPTVDVMAGMQFMVFHYFYFYVEAHYVHMQDPWRTTQLDQLMATGGLGFQLPVKRVIQKIKN